MPAATSRQRNRAFLRLGILPVEQRGVADGADAHAAAFVGDLRTEDFAFVAFGAEETELHQLVRAEEFVEFDKESRREAAFAELQRRVELLALAAEIRFLRAGERKVIHGMTSIRKVGAAPSVGSDFTALRSGRFPDLPPGGAARFVSAKQKTSMSRTLVKHALDATGPNDAILLQGWVRTRRDAKAFSFIELNDGSSFKGIQVIADAKLPN
jgi:hypothetical protein